MAEQICIEVFGNVWGLCSYDETNRHSTAFRKEDNRKLQVLVNKVLRSLTGLDNDTSTSVLSSTSGQLSVHQRTALFTITSVHKSLKTCEPSYNYLSFNSNQDDAENQNYTNCRKINYKLSISRCGFYYRGSRLYNQLPASLINNEKQSVFKRKAKLWVKENIPLLPP